MNLLSILLTVAHISTSMFGQTYSDLDGSTGMMVYANSCPAPIQLLLQIWGPFLGRCNGAQVSGTVASGDCPTAGSCWWHRVCGLPGDSIGPVRGSKEAFWVPPK